jgi:hypothetical protein
MQPSRHKGLPCMILEIASGGVVSSELEIREGIAGRHVDESHSAARALAIGTLALPMPSCSRIAQPGLMLTGRLSAGP